MNRIVVALIAAGATATPAHAEQDRMPKLAMAGYRVALDTRIPWF